MASYPFLSQAPTPVEVELGCDNFPTDPGTMVFNDSELLETLQSIQQVISNNQFHYVYWLGDINTDFLRRTGHVNCVKNFIEELNIKKAWDNYQVDFTHYQEMNGITHTSTVDHIFWNEASEDKIVDAGVVHLPENTSDHCPVYCVIDVGKVKIETSVPKISSPRPCWKKATSSQKDDFKSNLENDLRAIHIPDSLHSCKDVHCMKEEHNDDADNTIIQVLESVERNAYQNLPVPSPPRNKKPKSNMPGWSQEIEPFQDKAHFWHKFGILLEDQSTQNFIS